MMALAVMQRLANQKKSAEREADAANRRAEAVETQQAVSRQTTEAVKDAVERAEVKQVNDDARAATERPTGSFRRR